MVAVSGAAHAAGFALALASAGCYETGYAFQALEARAVPVVHALRPSLLGQLARNGRWVAATVLSLAGWPLQVAALALVPLALVQPTLALGLVLLLALGARVLGEPVGRREIGAVALIVAGVAIVAVAAPPRGADGATGLAIAGAGVAVVALAPYLPPVRPRAPALLLIVATGAADSLAALLAKLLSVELDADRWIPAAACVAVAAGAGLLATVSEMSALQRRPATRVAPVVLAMQVVVPVALGGLAGGEDWGATPLGGVMLGAGLAIVVAGVVVLASSPAVGDVIAVDQRSTSSSTAEAADGSAA
jgi:drug/metabolite transporter (DMT)-like permease